MVKVRLALGFLIIILGIVIIVRSIWVAAEKNMGLSVLWQPILLGSLMIAFGVHRWLQWRIKGWK